MSESKGMVSPKPKDILTSETATIKVVVNEEPKPEEATTEKPSKEEEVKKPSKVQIMTMESFTKSKPPEFKGLFYKLIIPPPYLLMIDHFCTVGWKQGYKFVKEWMVPQGILLLFEKRNKNR